MSKSFEISPADSLSTRRFGTMRLNDFIVMTREQMEMHGSDVTCAEALDKHYDEFLGKNDAAITENDEK